MTEIKELLDGLKTNEMRITDLIFKALNYCPEPGGDELKKKMMDFEVNIKSAWQKAYDEFGVKHCYDLPEDIYRKIADDNIHIPGIELMKWLLKKSIEWRNQSYGARNQPIEGDPYCLALAYLLKRYNIIKHENV